MKNMSEKPAPAFHPLVVMEYDGLLDNQSTGFDMSLMRIQPRNMIETKMGILIWTS